MKKDYSFKEKIAVEEALKALYHYNNACLFPVEDQYLDKEILEEYFLTDDVQCCKDIEKKVAAAAIHYCNDNPDILNKKRNALLMSTQMIEALRGAKIEAEYNLGKLGKGVIAEQKREELKRENSVVQKSVFLGKAKKTLKNMPLKMAKSTIRKSITTVVVASLASHGAFGATIAAGSLTIFGVTVGTPLLVGAAVAGGMALACEAVKHLTPKPVREAVKKKAKQAMTYASNVIEKNVQRFERTPVGQKVSSFVQEKVAPVVNRGIDAFKRGYEKAKSFAKSTVTRLKSWLSW